MRSLTLFELLVSLCIIFFLMGAFATYANTSLIVARETALQNELINIRMAIEYFRFVTQRLPKELEELRNYKLTSESLKGIITPNKFIDHARVDKEGFLLDPFMNRYAYDSASGRVWSLSKGREGW